MNTHRTFSHFTLSFYISRPRRVSLGLIIFVFSILLLPRGAHAQDITTGLIGHWKFDETSGTTASDSSGNSNTGTLTNGPAWTTGKVGSGSVSFDGVDDFISMANISLPSDFTVSAWASIDDVNPSSADEFIGHSDQASGSVKIFGSQTISYGCSNSIGNFDQEGAWARNVWEHIVITRQGTTVNAYRNGTQFSSPRIENYGTCVFNLIGSRGNTFFDGSIDDVRIYNRALSSSDIQALYTLGGSPPPPSSGDTVAPTTTITAPTSGSTVSDTVTVSANASDNIAVTRVEFYVDGVLKSTDTTSPYSFSWDTTNGGTHPCNGAHTHVLQARAYDAANNQGTSANVTVNMNNPSYCTTPSPPVNPASFTTPYDTIPNFAQNPTITSTANGNWSDMATWNPARLPNASDIVLVSHTVTYDSTIGDVDTVGIAAGGIFRFSTTQNTSVRVGNFLVQPQGTLEVGTQSNPIPANLTAEIVIKNKALNLTTDPNQFGTSLVSLGTVTMHGAVKSPTFVRTSAEPRAGNTTITLEQSVSGWRVGDQLVLPDSREDLERNNDAQHERRTIQVISGDGRTITLSSPLTYTHPGARDLNGALVFLPHVMNVTRNVVIRSENLSGTRGHTLHTNRAVVDIRYVEYRDLGRTTIHALSNTSNHIGRYALHFHHLMGPIATPTNGYQFTAVGNALWDSPAARSIIKWPVAIHDSHYGLVQGNVVYNGGGSGIVTEDGSESYNVIEGNAVFRILGEGDRVGTKSNGQVEPGSQGVGLWFHGPNNYVRNNVAANSIENQAEAAYGFEIFQTNDGGYNSNLKIPNFKGADTSVSGQYTTKSVYTIPILEFLNNEAYSSPQGMTTWWVGQEYHTPVATADSVIRNQKIWHISRYPYYGYPGNRIVFDGLQLYIDPANNYECCRTFFYGDYKNVDAAIRNSTMVGVKSVTLPYFGAGTTIVENSFIASPGGISNQVSHAPGSCPNCNLPDRIQIIRNVRFGAVPGSSLRTITMANTNEGSVDTDSKNEVYVYDYQGQVGNNFRVYYNEQGTQNIYGEQAPCTDITTHPEIIGITCPISGTPPPATLLGDLNGDRTVNNFDWNIMTGVWFTNDSIADINKDGIVNTADYYYIYANWGKSI